MKLVYLDHPGDEGAPTVVACHAEGLPGPSELDRYVSWARAAGAGRVVVPVGHYASCPSGMEGGGTCWYRVLPGEGGTDPISLATAVVQLGDLLEDLGRPGTTPPALLGWGQGAVVVLGTGLLWRDRVASVACVDASVPDVEQLPARCWSAVPPPVLVAATGRSAGDAVEAMRAVLAARGLSARTAAAEEADALAAPLGDWFRSAGADPATATKGGS